MSLALAFRKLPVIKYRSLITSIAISDLRLRYRNSFLGFIWSFLEPLLMLGVLYAVFTNLLGAGIKNYPLYLLLGLIMWNMYSRSTLMGLSALLSRSGIVSKIYIPREILSIASSITSSIMMLFELGAFALFMVFFQFVPPITILYLPLIFGILFILSVGVSLPLAVANIYFRDLQYIWGVILQAGFFLSPIVFTLDVYPKELSGLLYLNPITGLIDMAHEVTLYGVTPAFDDFLYPLVMSLIVLATGYAIFRKYESKAIELL